MVIPVVRPTGEGSIYEVLGEQVTLKVTGEETAGAYALVEEISPPGGGPPLHVHSREDEAFYILEGEYEFRIGDQVIRAKPGDFLYAPKHLQHTFRNVSDSNSKMVISLIPAGFEGFFRETGELTQSGPPEIPVVIELGKKYGLEFV